jgi:UDP-glucuronate 4-epimerase
LYKFTKAILDGEPIDVFNHGDMSRDFTYISDLVEALARLIPIDPKPLTVPNLIGDSLSPVAPFRVINIGNSKPVQLTEFITSIEKALGRKATLNFLPMQPGDVKSTFADTSLLRQLTGYEAKTSTVDGVKHFVSWYTKYYGAKGEAA